MLSSSRGQRDEGHRAAQVVSECASHVISFDNLAESSPDSHKASQLGRATDVQLPPPMTTPDWYSYCGFTCLFWFLTFMLFEDDATHPSPLECME
jgi:hypothetical protein